MTINTIDESQRKAARVAGFTYLFLLVTAGFAELYVRSNLIVDGNAAETVRNIVASERLFRIGIASDLVASAGNVVVAIALYALLKPVSPSLALLAAFWRLAEGTILGVITLTSLVALELLGGADYLQVFGTGQLQALAMLLVGAQGAGYTIGLVFFSLGSTVFSYLLFKSRYIPRTLAAWGVFSSLLALAFTLAIIVFPNLGDIAASGGYVPVGIFELTVGLWLLIRGIGPSGAPEPDKNGG